MRIYTTPTVTPLTGVADPDEARRLIERLLVIEEILTQVLRIPQGLYDAGHRGRQLETLMALGEQTGRDLARQGVWLSQNQVVVDYKIPYSHSRNEICFRTSKGAPRKYEWFWLSMRLSSWEYVGDDGLLMFIRDYGDRLLKLKETYFP